MHRCARLRPRMAPNGEVSLRAHKWNIAQSWHCALRTAKSTRGFTQRWTKTGGVSTRHAPGTTKRPMRDENPGSHWNHMGTKPSAMVVHSKMVPTLQLVREQAACPIFETKAIRSRVPRAPKSSLKSFDGLLAGTYIAPPQQRPFPELLPLPPDAPRISVSACQAREVARRYATSLSVL